MASLALGFPCLRIFTLFRTLNTQNGKADSGPSRSTADMPGTTRSTPSRGREIKLDHRCGPKRSCPRPRPPLIAEKRASHGNRGDSPRSGPRFVSGKVRRIPRICEQRGVRRAVARTPPFRPQRRKAERERKRVGARYVLSFAAQYCDGNVRSEKRSFLNRNTKRTAIYLHDFHERLFSLEFGP